MAIGVSGGGGGPGEQRRRWVILVATIWIQAFTGTNFDFSAYSSGLKSVLGISQVQLNYLAVASDMGKALGWSSGLALLHLPLWSVLLLASTMGLVGYALQWLLLAGFISLPYFPVFLLCLLSGCSICWFNTVCFVLCIRNFPNNRPLALSLTISFNGVSAALYTLVADAVSSSSNQPLYLLLNASVPLIASLVALIPILRQPASPQHQPPESVRQDSHVFLVLNVLAFITGIYLLLLNSASSNHLTARILLGGAILLLILPLFIPGVVCTRDWARDNLYSSFRSLDGGGSGFGLIDDLELHKSFLSGNDSVKSFNGGVGDDEREGLHWSCCAAVKKDRLVSLGEEHTARRLVRRIDFWLYYVAYFCGATVGLVYSNNLGQIAQSLGRASETTMLVSVYSACSFFGRLISSAPDFLRGKVYLARTGWMSIALVPMPLAFFLMAEAGDGHALLAGTALVGLSSGFIFAAAVSVTSELFGPNSIGLNHNILITNIPLGSLLYGLLAALVYDANGNSSLVQALLGDGAVVCMGRKCYAVTFLSWACITLVGVASSVALFLRTRLAYNRFELDRTMAVLD